MHVLRTSVLSMLLIFLSYVPLSIAETYFLQPEAESAKTESLKESVETNADTASDIPKAEVVKVLYNMERDLKSAGNYSLEETAMEDFTRYETRFFKTDTPILEDVKYDAERMNCFEKNNLIRCIFMTGMRREVLEWEDIESMDFMFFQDEVIMKREGGGRLFVVELCRDGCRKIGLRP